MAAICCFKSKCHLRNPKHFRTLGHPHLEDLLDKILKGPGGAIVLPEKLDFKCIDRALLLDQLEALREARRIECTTNLRSQILSSLKDNGKPPAYHAEQGKFLEKHRNAAPYHIFFTVVQKCTTTWRDSLSVTLPELLDTSLGKIIHSLHINFIVDIDWLCSQYKLADQATNMSVYCAERVDESPLPAHIKVHKIACPNAIGRHNSKLSILQYEDGGIRVIVSTANFYRDDWELRTQGLWMSCHLPLMPAHAKAITGDSRTGFKQDLLRYLEQYSIDMDRWRAMVKRRNFSSVNVALVASVPGTYCTDYENHNCGHKKLATILKQHVDIPEDEPCSTIVAQTSSMEVFGENSYSLTRSGIVNSMAQTMTGDSEYKFKVIFPTIENYKKSYDFKESANCLGYSESEHRQQKWITNFLCRWTARCISRTWAMPHINTYTRISNDDSKIWWFVLGSANLSKASWGYLNGGCTCVLNYEVSVVFLPKFVTITFTFPVKPIPDCTTPIFPIPYDLPLLKYNRYHDKPFVSEFLVKGDRVLNDDASDSD